MPEYVERSYHEALVNALAHRDPLTVPSTRRNPVLADIFNQLGYMERKGSGFGKSSAAMNFRSTMMKVKSRLLNLIGISLQL